MLVVAYRVLVVSKVLMRSTDSRDWSRVGEGLIGFQSRWHLGNKAHSGLNNCFMPLYPRILYCTPKPCSNYGSQKPPIVQFGFRLQGLAQSRRLRVACTRNPEPENFAPLSLLKAPTLQPQHGRHSAAGFPARRAKVRQRGGKSAGCKVSGFRT